MSRGSVPEVPYRPPIARSRIRLLAQLDGTDPVADSITTARMDDFKAARGVAGDALHVSAQVYRNAMSGAMKVAAGVGCLAATLVPPVLLACSGIPMGAGYGVVALVGAGLFGLPVAGLRFLADGLHRQNPGERWSGKRVYDEVSSDKGSGIDSLPTETLKNSIFKKFLPRPETYANFLTRNMDPTAHNILFFDGHGWGFRYIAGLSTRQIASGIAQARAKTGARPDVLLMEDCLAGNWEAMSDLRHGGGYAIVSENVMQGGTFPMQRILIDATRTEHADPEHLARQVFERAAESVSGPDGVNTTLSLIDLNAVEPFNAAMGQLGRCLLQDMKEGQANGIRQAVRNATPMPVGTLASWMISRSTTNLSDLGSLFEHLSNAPLRPETHAALSVARAALGRVVLEHRTQEPTRHCSGLSFQPRWSGRAGSELESFEETDVPADWKAFIRAIRA